MWYNTFSHFYDAALEKLYAPFRPEAIAALRLNSGQRVIDLPCGTGHHFQAFSEAGVHVLAADLSSGMLSQAKKRIQKRGLENIHCLQIDAQELNNKVVYDALGGKHVDAIICALGFTAFNNWEQILKQSFSLLKPGGRFVIFDVYAQKRTFQTRSVELVARADLSRKCWEPLEALCKDFSKHACQGADPKKFGGELYVASGTNPEANEALPKRRHL